MAHHNDAIKRNTQNQRRRARNKHFRTRMRTQIKAVRTAVEAGDHAAAMDELRKAQSLIDRNVTKGIVHRNKAARSIARLNAAVRELA